MKNLPCTICGTIKGIMHTILISQGKSFFITIPGFIVSWNCDLPLFCALMNRPNLSLWSHKHRGCPSDNATSTQQDYQSISACRKLNVFEEWLKSCRPTCHQQTTCLAWQDSPELPPGYILLQKECCVPWRDQIFLFIVQQRTRSHYICFSREIS